jgi:hypothetical protein
MQTGKQTIFISISYVLELTKPCISSSFAWEHKTYGSVHSHKCCISRNLSHEQKFKFSPILLYPTGQTKRWSPFGVLVIGSLLHSFRRFHSLFVSRLACFICAAYTTFFASSQRLHESDRSAKTVNRLKYGHDGVAYV